MEGVVEALNRARTLSFGDIRTREGHHPDRVHKDDMFVDPFRGNDLPAVKLSSRRLKNQRVVAFDPKDRQTRAFDLLRNGFLASVAPDATRIISVASPTHGCGTSVVAANVAFSIARKRQWRVLLATLDGMSPAFERLGLCVPEVHSSDASGIEVGKVEVDDVLVHVGSFAHIAIREGSTAARHALVSAWLDEVRHDCGPTIVVLDLPPLLTNDDSQAIAARSDIALLVLGVGSSTVADLEACRGSLTATPHQIVLNKARRHGL